MLWGGGGEGSRSQKPVPSEDEGVASGTHAEWVRNWGASKHTFLWRKLISAPRDGEGIYSNIQGFGAVRIALTAPCPALLECIAGKTPSNRQKRHKTENCLKDGWLPRDASHAELIERPLILCLSKRSAEVTVSHSFLFRKIVILSREPRIVTQHLQKSK